MTSRFGFLILAVLLISATFAYPKQTTGQVANSNLATWDNACRRAVREANRDEIANCVRAAPNEVRPRLSLLFNLSELLDLDGSVSAADRVRVLGMKGQLTAEQSETVAVSNRVGIDIHNRNCPSATVDFQPRPPAQRLIQPVPNGWGAALCVNSSCVPILGLDELRLNVEEDPGGSTDLRGSTFAPSTPSE